MDLKPITEDDLEFTRNLRNSYKEYFFDNSTVTKEAQINWYINCTKNYIGFYVIWDNDTRVGTVSLRNCAFNPSWNVDNCNYVEIGNIMTVADVSRKGIATNAMSEVMIKNPYNYISFVKHDNYKSANLFRKLGFKESTHNQFIIFTKKIS